MVGSLWRYSHFLLAIISALFLVLASVTGAILALEPINNSTPSYAIANTNTISVAETLTVLKQNYNAILDVEITSEDFVIVNVVTLEGDTKRIYVNPINGTNLGNVNARSSFFTTVTNLHRSLFLKSIGRAFVGIVSLLLCFITITGVFLLAQRQGGLKKWFSKVQEKDPNQRYHVILGRWFLLPILIVAATGVYLSAEKFSLLPEEHTVALNWNAIPDATLQQIAISEFTVFKELPLSQVRKISFPFSDDESDYFEVALEDRELLVHQYTGEILSTVDYPFVKLASRFSLQLHTGEGNVLWSIILFLASLSLLFFMFSGFAIRIKRSKKSKELINMYTKDEAEFILLVGSESRSTYAFAKAYTDALSQQGKRVYTASLNEYSKYQNAKHLIVFTATYGDGNAPTNARKFESLFKEIHPARELLFSVVGFGSMDYPKYCQFAVNVDALLHQHPQFRPVQPLVKINEQSKNQFAEWVHTWNVSTGMQLTVSFKKQKQAALKEQTFTVVEKTALILDTTFLIRLRPHKKTAFQSGDLLNILPPEASKTRQYSIARIGDDILLSVRWHSQGICSTYLCNLKKEAVVSATIQKNKTFHFPKKAPAVWCISNGTGIAPFLGMIHKHTEVPIEFLWGGKTQASFDFYREVIDISLSLRQAQDGVRKRALKIQFAFSQTAPKMYVQDVLKLQQITVAQALKKGTVFMICGSLKMQDAVLNTLEEITKSQLNRPLSDFENNQQILTDCY